MRAFIGLIVIVYLVGVGVVLAPSVKGRWDSGTASELSQSIAAALPNALAWPAAAFRSLTGQVEPPARGT